MNSVWLARYAAAGHRVSPNNEIVPSVFAARPRCRLVYANRNDDDREAGYKHLLFTMRQRLTRSCVIPAAPRPSLFLSHLSHRVFLRPPRPVSTPCQVHTRRAIRSACECVRVRVTLIIKRRIITARTRSEHRVYGTYLLHNNVPPLVVCRGGVGRARSSTGGGEGYRCWIYGRASDSTPTPLPFAPRFPSWTCETVFVRLCFIPPSLYI